MIPLAAKLHMDRSIEPTNLARELLERAGVKVFGRKSPAFSPDEVPRFPAEEYDAVVVFLASGGTSELAAKVAAGNPYFIWAYDEVNSLSSALSVREKLNGIEAWRGEIVYNSLDDAPVAVLGEARASRLIKSMRERKVGLIGDNGYFDDKADELKALTDSLGVEIVKIPISDLIAEFRSQNDDQASKMMDEKFSDASVMEPSKKDLQKSCKMYLAFKSLVSKSNIDAVSLDCFRLIKRTGTSACLAFSLLADEGKVSVCEGDLRSAALMLIFREIAGPSWLGNLVQIDRSLNTITLAHCTAPTSLAQEGGRIILRNHFESGEGVSLDVPLRRSGVTVTNIQFKPLQMVVAKGELLESQIGRFSLCRTQAKIKLEGRVDRLLQHTGNHHVVAYGDWAETLARVAKKLNMSLVEV
jgi:L-fucose isomerase-like protein